MLCRGSRLDGGRWCNGAPEYNCPDGWERVFGLGATKVGRLMFGR